MTIRIEQRPRGVAFSGYSPGRQTDATDYGIIGGDKVWSTGRRPPNGNVAEKGEAGFTTGRCKSQTL